MKALGDKTAFYEGDEMVEWFKALNFLKGDIVVVPGSNSHNVHFIY